MDETGSDGLRVRAHCDWLTSGSILCGRHRLTKTDICNMIKVNTHELHNKIENISYTTTIT